MVLDRHCTDYCEGLRFASHAIDGRTAGRSDPLLYASPHGKTAAKRIEPKVAVPSRKPPLSSAARSRSLFPPRPRGLKGRSVELATLSDTIEAAAPTRLALVGSGGSGKSMLACALGHRLMPRFEGRVHWFRVGAWDFYTLTEVLALHFGTELQDGRVRGLKRFFTQGGERLIVLDNHEDDRTMARLLETFAKTPVTFVITARRCLLAGVFIFPVTAPLVMSGRSAFPRVAALTRMLRFNPLALDIADSIVASRAANVMELAAFLEENGVSRVVAIEHEDDLPEIALLVSWAWKQLDADGRRMLAVLAHTEGDHIDLVSLAQLARVRSRPEEALAPLQRWHLVQEPVDGRFTLHAVVRHAIKRRTNVPQLRFYDYYVTLLERHPERLLLEQTHLFAAMDHAHRNNDLGAMLRAKSLSRRLAGVVEIP